MPTKPDIRPIVDCMTARLAAERCLYQHEVVAELYRRKESALLSVNADGNEGLDKAVFKAFRKRTPDAVQSRPDQMWRHRVKTDAPRRMQD